MAILIFHWKGFSEWPFHVNINTKIFKHMKRFGSLFLAAILGSLITISSFQYLKDNNEGVSLHFQSTPAAQVAYAVNENGEAIPVNFSDAAEKVMPAVVHISSRQNRTNTQESNDPLRDFFGPYNRRQGPSQSSGSGVIINPQGYIVTNNHVVKDADLVEVTLIDNRTYKAEVIGTDPDTDLAVIRISEQNLPFLAFEDSDKSRVGEWVLAVGNPFNLTSTVTAGIISAKGRSINILRTGDENGNTAIESFIQTDAAINPGNSGGALVNLQGGLLGINTAIASTTGAYAGYGFAVPSNIVNKIVEDLIEYGVVQRGWLGVNIQSVNSQLAKQFDLDVNEGAYIAGFAENSSAKDTGIKEGDVVVKIDDVTIRTNADLIEQIGRHRPGDQVEVTVDRKGKSYTYPVTLKTRNGDEAIVKREKLDEIASLGIVVEEVEERTLNMLDLKNGVRVKELSNGKIRRYTNLHEGFIITKVNDESIHSVEEFNKVMKKFGPERL